MEMQVSICFGLQLPQHSNICSVPMDLASLVLSEQDFGGQRPRPPLSRMSKKAPEMGGLTYSIE